MTINALLYKRSYRWAPTEQIAITKTLYESAVSLQLDSSTFKYAEKMGMLYREVDSLALSLEYFNKSLAASYDIASQRIIYNSLGGLYRKYRDEESALTYYFKSLELARELDDGSEAYPLGNISEVYSILGEYKNAIKYLKQSIAFSQKLSFPEKQYSEVYDYCYLAGYYHELGQFDSSDYALQRTLKSIEQIDTIRLQKFMDAKFVGFFALADLCIKRKKHEAAQMAIKNVEKNAQSYYYSSVLMLKAKLAMSKSHYRNALNILNSEKIAEEYSGKEEVIRLKAECHDKLGNTQLVIDLQRQLLDAQSINFTESKAKFAQFAHIKHETFKKNEQIESLRSGEKIKNLKLRNQGYVVGLLASLIALFAILGRQLYLKNVNRKKVNTLLEAKVADQTKELVRTSREISKLNYIASHNLKEPLRSIGSYASLIEHKSTLGDDPQFEAYFTFIKSNVKRMHNLLDDIVHLNSANQLADSPIQSVNLSNLISRIKREHANDENKTLGEIAHKDLPKIHSNLPALEAIFKILIENGLKYNRSAKPKVNVSYQNVNNKHVIKIKDNGIGIDPKYQQQIFESYTRLHNTSEFEGSGIGLSIAKALAEKIGGSIKVESSSPEGSTFAVNIPVSHSNS